uniref:Uncharacterized protein n=1 Tax=Alexandrium monilatum TaxID=311494 RepID=A0A7S4SAX2_9DINO
MGCGARPAETSGAGLGRSVEVFAGLNSSARTGLAAAPWTFISASPNESGALFCSGAALSGALLACFGSRGSAAALCGAAEGCFGSGGSTTALCTATVGCFGGGGSAAAL